MTNAPGGLSLLLAVAGEPAQARVFAKNGEEVPDWELGPPLAEALARLADEGWVVSEGRLTRQPTSLHPVPILLLRQRGNPPDL